MPTFQFARPIYGVIVLTSLGGLAFALGYFTFKTGRAPIIDAIRADGATFEHRWAALGMDAEPRTTIKSEVPSTTQLPKSQTDFAPEPVRATLATLGRAADLSEKPAGSEPEHYIFYYNSPTHWTPVPLPEGIADDRAPHNRNIRAEIEQAAMLFDVDIRMMKAFARIESGYNPKVTTGKYKCLFQLSDWEFAKYWRGDIYDIRDCSIAAARKLATEAAQFEKDVGRRATAAEIYCIHQQGYQGCAFHYAAPHQLAWKNMYLTAEGQQRGEAWARKAIWGNVPSDIKDRIKGGVDALTSGEFIAIWTERVERFMARKSEPPTDYVEYSSKAKKPAKIAAKANAKATAKSNGVTGTAKKKRVAQQAIKKKNKVKVAAR
ncbi:MAG: hypothetical protein ACO1NY_04635 [Pseudorhodoplanes sp.]